MHAPGGTSCLLRWLLEVGNKSSVGQVSLSEKTSEEDALCMTAQRSLWQHQRYRARIRFAELRSRLSNGKLRSPKCSLAILKRICRPGSYGNMASAFAWRRNPSKFWSCSWSELGK